jgi:hypothetical protein
MKIKIHIFIFDAYDGNYMVEMPQTLFSIHIYIYVQYLDRETNEIGFIIYFNTFVLNSAQHFLFYIIYKIIERTKNRNFIKLKLNVKNNGST